MKFKFTQTISNEVNSPVWPNLKVASNVNEASPMQLHASTYHKILQASSKFLIYLYLLLFLRACSFERNNLFLLNDQIYIHIFSNSILIYLSIFHKWTKHKWYTTISFSNNKNRIYRTSYIIWSFIYSKHAFSSYNCLQALH